MSHLSGSWKLQLQLRKDEKQEHASKLYRCIYTFDACMSARNATLIEISLALVREENMKPRVHRRPETSWNIFLFLTLNHLLGR